ncbi:septum site-determining protein MinC [Alkalihalobacterium elongatum]|uniref:septum site-determining protein MinC n=1 Tax=Alkalihalobacterium elongatum TaxID=2675466 RepID=UPI001C1FB8B2|nr:septum site-determining protein MinC [Alkalihalobacterium elongatum]
MLQKKHHVTIKGTKDGLTFLLNDNCSFESIVKELKEKLSSKHYEKSDGPAVKVHIVTGNRYLTEDQENELQELVCNGKNLIIEQIETNVITKEEAERIAEEKQTVMVSKIVRSGQVFKVIGDLLLIGDVNPGGAVVATGNIFVMGALRGMAQAGSDGDESAVIAASVMAPSQLKISEHLRQEPNRNEQVDRQMECAYINSNDNTIVLERIQQLPWLRPSLNRSPEKVTS